MNEKPNELTVADVKRAASPTMQILLDDQLFSRAVQISKYLARAKGITPPHLLGQEEACFAVVTRSLTWNLDPFAVAQSTYQVGGKVAYEGKLVQAILEQSGRIAGPIKREFYGDWSNVQGKFKLNRGKNNNDYPVPNWSPEDEQGLGIIVSAMVKGETEPREFDFKLVQAFPRNSTLWATDPQTQLSYTAIRRFASVAVPSLMFGVPFDDDDEAGLIDITPPAPVRDDFIENAGHANLDDQFAATVAETEPQDASTEGDANPADDDAADDPARVVDTKPATDGPADEDGPKGQSPAGLADQDETDRPDDTSEAGRVELPGLGAKPDVGMWRKWIDAVKFNLRFDSIGTIDEFKKSRKRAFDALADRFPEMANELDDAINERLAELA